MLLFSGCERKYNSKKYTDVQTVLELFKKNQDDFDGMIVMLDEKKEMFTNMWEEIGHRCIFGPYGYNSTKYLKEYLTAEEYEQLIIFFENYRPYEIANKNQYSYFVFLREGGSVLLYYIDMDNDEETEQLLNYIEQNGECIQLNENWYYQDKVIN